MTTLVDSDYVVWLETEQPRGLMTMAVEGLEQAQSRHSAYGRTISSLFA